jgi:hypothetical protein
MLRGPQAGRFINLTPSDAAEAEELGNAQIVKKTPHFTFKDPQRGSSYLTREIRAAPPSTPPPPVKVVTEPIGRKKGK